MHARPGLELGYLSDEWFALWEHAAAEAGRLGMLWHIYDEYTCPGGHAGGHVVADASHVAGRELRLVEARRRRQLRKAEQALAWFDADGAPADAAGGDAPQFAAVLSPLPGNPAKGGFPMPDLTHPDAVKAFIRSTHARYREVSGAHFGTTVRYCFCDEPSLYHSTDGLTLSPPILREFEKEHGYRLEDRLDAFCMGAAGAPEVRYDYWATMRRLFDENFFKGLHDWCAANGLKFTGHVMENQWPKPLANPDSMATYRWMQAPGNDLLGFQFLRTRLRDNGLYLLNLKELASAAAQLGRDRDVMVESSGADGYGAAFALFKTCEDFLLAFGITVMDPHLSHWTLGGSRKYDWAQTLSPHSPWWACYRGHADHVARVIAAQREGVERNRVLVLHPTLSGWLDGRPETGGWKPSGEVTSADLGSATQSFYLDLYAGQVDFDLGDEILLRDLDARTAEGRFAVGERGYEVIVLPPVMLTWTASTLERITTWLEAGGSIFVAGDAPARVDGRIDPRPAALAERFAEQWRRFEDNASLVAALREAVPPRLSAPDGRPLSEDLVWRRTELPEGGTLWFFCAPWETGVRAQVKVEGSGAVELDTATGDGVAFGSESEGESESESESGGGGSVVFDLDLPARGHRFFLVDGRVGTAAEAASAALSPIEPEDLTFVSAEAVEPNLLLLDYCRLSRPGDSGEFGEATGTLHTDAENWRRHGFDGNPWQMGHMFKRNWLEYPFPDDVGCAVAYDFEIALDGVDRSSLEIVVERPWLYDISLNDQSVPEAAFVQWFDREFARAPVGDLIREGANRLVLRAKAMTALVEIMPVYLRGGFHVLPAAGGFRAVAPRPLAEGDLTVAGLPFYRGWVRHSYRFTLDAPREGLALRLPDFTAAAARVSVDGGAPVDVLHPPYVASFPGQFSAGEHSVCIELASSLRNMMGPHHVRGLNGPWSWMAAPAQQPPGESYVLDHFGIGAPANPIISNPNLS
ncbi:MAG: hypothetical protein ACLFTU_10180 [Puniceicoccaceae bacterium]